MANEELIKSFNNARYASTQDMDPEASAHFLRYEIIEERVKRLSCSATSPEKFRVLDVGCGPGNLAEQLLKGGYEVWGCDVSANALAVAEKKGIRVKAANLETGLPFADGEFDCVVATEIIEHIYDTESFTRELARVLSPKGTLIVTTPNVASIARRAMLLLGINPYLDYQLGGTAGHIRYFTFRDMRRLLEQSGLRVLNQSSDAVNLSWNGKVFSRGLGALVPTLGRCIITEAVRS